MEPHSVSTSSTVGWYDIFSLAEALELEFELPTEPFGVGKLQLESAPSRLVGVAFDLEPS